MKQNRLKSSYLPIRLNNSGLLLLLKLTFRIYSLIDMGVLESCLRLFEKHRPNQMQIPLVPVTKKNVITFDDFQIEGKLGQGGFGVVFLGQLKKNIDKGITQKFAIKMVSKKKLKQHNVVQNAINEKIIAMTNHDFIVSLVMSFQDQWYIYFVLEYAGGGDTYSLIKKSSPKFPAFAKLGEAGVRFIAGCVILGLEYVHKNNYMYRDLKPENVMIFQDGYVKISDFGLAKKTVEGKNNKTIMGTRFYYAPQMLLRKGYDKKIDLWELGVYLYEMSNYDLPFLTEEITPQKFELVCRQAQLKRVWKNPNLSPELKDLIHNLLRFEPNLRIGARSWSQIKQHDFFKGFDWDALQQLKMQSPLKEIVKKNPTAVKEYNPQTIQFRKTGQKPKIQGWTYYGSYLDD